MDPNESILPFLNSSGMPADKKDVYNEPNENMCIGLTKREHFAGLAMSSYFGGEYIGQSGMPYETIAVNCVLMADALIAELNKTSV